LPHEEIKIEIKNENHSFYNLTDEGFFGYFFVRSQALFGRMDVAQWFAHQFFNSHFWLGPEFDAKCVCYCVGEESAEEKNLLYTHIPTPFPTEHN